MKFEKKKTSKLLEFLRPGYITVGRGNSKVSSSWHTLLTDSQGKTERRRMRDEGGDVDVRRKTDIKESD